MTTEKADYTPVEVGSSHPPGPGNPNFPAVFGVNVPGPEVHGGGVLAPGGLPYPPPPVAFAPVVPGIYGAALKPQDGSSGYVNPMYPGYPENAPPYSPPAPGFVDTYSGILGVNCPAHGDICVCGHFHLCERSEGFRPAKHLDVLLVLRRVLRVGLCDQLLRKRPPETPLESGGTSKTNWFLQQETHEAEVVSAQEVVWCFMLIFGLLLGKKYRLQFELVSSQKDQFGLNYLSGFQSVLTLSMSYMVGTIASFHETESVIMAVSTHPLTGKVDEGYQLHLTKRYTDLMEELSQLEYKAALHPPFCEFIINTYGILKERPSKHSSQGTEYNNPDFLMKLIENIAPRRLQKDLLLVLSCLCYMAVKDKKPLLAW
ncbi:hypothetical protein XENOCAPTIV_002498 [Xenoophorus captivus]|uniref:Speriolin C-terminal domain-containing protein n=1 Tax=Xenoophorus captivus TaxID=1517983 RepID=A0ABV0QQQ0_9TELE